MVTIEIRVNGKLKATCGADGLRQLIATVAARRSRAPDAEFSYVVECMGVRPRNSTTDEVLKWVSTRIALGDEVSFKIIEATQAQEPIDRQDIPAHAPSDN
jgi:hypothetical protein